MRSVLSEFTVGLEAGEEIGNIYPEVVLEIGGQAARPESRSVGDFADYLWEADLVITNNVYDYMAREDFFEAMDITGADFVEMYSVMPDVRDSIQQEGNLDIDPEFDPEVSFQWAGLDGVTVVLFS